MVSLSSLISALNLLISALNLLFSALNLLFSSLSLLFSSCSLESLSDGPASFDSCAVCVLTGCSGMQYHFVSRCVAAFVPAIVNSHSRTHRGVNALEELSVTRMPPPPRDRPDRLPPEREKPLRLIPDIDIPDPLL